MTNDTLLVSEQEQNAIMALCILAAFADGTQSEPERSEIKRVAEKFSNPNVNLSAVYQDALAGKTSWRDAAGELQSANAKTLAYEMAVCICNVDGNETPSEKQFLKSLRESLRLESSAAAFQQTASTLAGTALPTPPVIANYRNDQELDEMILNRAILAGALEIMPHTLAVMGIVPVQMQMVYSIGKKYGYELDWSHTKEFLATISVGMASQMVEGYLTRFVSGVTKKFAGRIAGSFIHQATQSALAFATTYAIGQAAKSYYSGGRTLSGAQLRDVFTSMLGQGRSLQSRYSTQILDRARSINPADLVTLAR